LDVCFHNRSDDGLKFGRGSETRSDPQFSPQMSGLDRVHCHFFSDCQMLQLLRWLGACSTMHFRMGLSYLSMTL
jgi:hypothetical protein